MKSGTRRQREAEGGMTVNGVPDSHPILPTNPISHPTADAPADSVVELCSRGQLPRLDLGIDWESPWQAFRSSVRDFFSGKRAPKESELGSDCALRVDWVGGKNSPWAFALSSACHAIAATLLLLPIWGFLPATAHNLGPVQLEVNWNAQQDLPPIRLAPKLRRPALFRKLPAAAKLARHDAPVGADAFHPRQTILSIPVQLTHPKQTLIEPAAPMTAPRIETKLPDIVEWAAGTQKVELLQSAAPPELRRREWKAAAPDVASPESDTGPLNLAPSMAPALRPPIPAMVATTPRPRRSQITARARPPEFGAANGDAGLRNVIALSASPAPPAPVALPQGNLAARVAVSPAGTHAGAPNGSGRGMSGGSAGPGGSDSLPAAVNVSGGGLAANQPQAKLNLKPMAVRPERPTRTGPADLAALKPNEPPEALFYGKEVHTLDINLPNVTSVSGSWILNFAQLEERGSPFNRSRGMLSGPIPVIKVDPKYPPELIHEHVEGEVVLYAIVRANGSVGDIQIVRKVDPRLDLYAVQALAQWKFRPATRDGVPVDIEAVVHIPFKYRVPER
jgi:TonB family protein